MNGQRKFHSARGPAFSVGETWISANGICCKIVSVRLTGDGKWDAVVTAEYSDGAQFSKDAWSFQVRYTPVADRFL